MDWAMFVHFHLVFQVTKELDFVTVCKMGVIKLGQRLEEEK